MLRPAADECLDDRIVRGVRQRNPDVDLVRVQEAGLSGKDDPTVLEWAAAEGRVLFTHNVNTMTAHAYERVNDGEYTPGVFGVRRDLPIGDVVEDILLIAQYSLDAEYEGEVRYLPLR